MIDLEFIERCNLEFKSLGDELQRLDRMRWKKWIDKSPERYKDRQKKYFLSEKGIYASSKRNSTRRNKFKAACEDLSWEEKINIGKFYKNCPKGYEVDHIIPVSKGGKHRLSNLQYLTKEDNRRKSNKV